MSKHSIPEEKDALSDAAASVPISDEPTGAAGGARKAVTPASPGRVRLPLWWRPRKRAQFKVPGRLEPLVISADRARLQEAARRDRDSKITGLPDSPSTRRRKLLVALGTVLMVVGLGAAVCHLTAKYGARVDPRFKWLHDRLLAAKVAYRMHFIVTENNQKAPIYAIVQKDLSPLKGIPLPGVYVQNKESSDISALEGMPLKVLVLNYTQVADITPLKGMPLEFLDIRSTRVTNVSAMAGMPLLCVAFSVNPVPSGVEVLRDIKTLKLINKMKAEDFWLMFDRGLIGAVEPAAPVLEDLSATNEEATVFPPKRRISFDISTPDDLLPLEPGPTAP